MKPVHYAKRRHGGFEVGIINTHDSAGLVARVEAATRTKGSLEVPDWRHAEVVQADATVAAGAMQKVTVPKAAASHTHYRVVMRSQATGVPASFLIYSEDEQS